MKDAHHRHRGRLVRWTGLGLGVATVLVGGTILSHGASRSAEGPAAPMTRPWTAPVGHRQPQASERPPQVGADEGAITQSEHDFDTKRLSICRGC
jgi:hypothetical protein